MRIRFVRIVVWVGSIVFLAAGKAHGWFPLHDWTAVAILMVLWLFIFKAFPGEIE